MKNIKTLVMTLVAAGGLAAAGCEKRAPSADQQGTGYTASQDPAPQPAPSPTASGAPTAAPPSSADPAGAPLTPAGEDRQNVAGREAAAGAGVHWIDEQGNTHEINDTAMLTQIQQKLAAEGDYKGATDGKNTPELTAAIRAYQGKNKIPESGGIDKRTADTMGLDWSKLSAKNETMGDKVDRTGAAVENKAGELGREVEAGAKDMGRDLESGAQKVEGGAKEVGRDIESGAKEAGREIESGAQKVGNELEKGANEAGREIDENVK
jgi:hypothetical protein